MALAVLTLFLALAIDAACGEPRDALHPVAWMGRSATWLLQLAPARDVRAQLVFGLGLAVGLPTFWASVARDVGVALSPWPWAAVGVGALLLKSTFAMRALGEAGLAVRRALSVGNIDAARYNLRALCSRDASCLDVAHVTAATIESLAENASDSVVAPLFWFAVAGLPGAVFYRAVNTLDAMIGYHGRYEYLGKAAARLDDALNYVPARLTAGLLLVAGAVRGADVRAGRAMLRRDGGRTESPNAGRPMAAMAGLLRVRLEKEGHYSLGDAHEGLRLDMIDEAWRIARTACVAMLLLASLALGVRHALAS
jgi:adenosylcobinamide-phosphate synthase